MSNQEALDIFIRIGSVVLLGALIGVVWWGIKELVRWIRGADQEARKVVVPDTTDTPHWWRDGIVAPITAAARWVRKYWQ